MPTYKISQLTTATAVSATNQFEINQNGTSKSVAVSVIDAYIKSTSNLPVVVSVSSATDAVRITQTGTGNALVVEDAANPDSSPFVIDASGNVGIGTSSPGSALDVKGTLRLSGATSGYVGLAPAAAAGSTTYTLPAADGTSGQVLSTNGSGTLSWASSGGTGTLKNVQVFTSSGTYTRTAGVTTAVVIARGGGGGGGGTSNLFGGGNGGNGGTTSFGSHVSAAGGTAGGNSSAGNPGAGGTGGTSATLAIPGTPGTEGNNGESGGAGGGEGGGIIRRGGSAGAAGSRGGGGSGGCTSVPCVGVPGGGGGGQGEFAMKYTTTVGATETVTIGAAGTAGTAGTGGHAGGAGGAGYIIVYEYS